MLGGGTSLRGGVRIACALWTVTGCGGSHGPTSDAAIDALAPYQLAFQGKIDFPCDRPVSVAIADLNGDGKPDVAVTDYSGSIAMASVSVFVNTMPPGVTVPSFAAKADFVGGSHGGIAIGDVDGDGKRDLAVASAAAAVFVNTAAANAPTASFASPVELMGGLYPREVALGDFNGDGKSDLAVSNYDVAQVSIYTNTTAAAAPPSFSPEVDIPTKGRYAVVVPDLDGDGKPDLVIGNDVGVSVLLNTTTTGATTPSFSASVDLATVPTASPHSVAAGDLNGDGKPDLVVLGGTASTVSILLDTTATSATTPTFSAKADFTVGPDPYAVALADFNGDGKLDVVVANTDSSTNAGSVSVLLNTTAPSAMTPTFASKVDFPTGNEPVSIAVGDLNGDGKPDLAVANADGISILLAK